MSARRAAILIVLTAALCGCERSDPSPPADANRRPTTQSQPAFPNPSAQVLEFDRAGTLFVQDYLYRTYYTELESLAKRYNMDHRELPVYIELGPDGKIEFVQLALSKTDMADFQKDLVTMVKGWTVPKMRAGGCTIVLNLSKTYARIGEGYRPPRPNVATPSRSSGAGRTPAAGPHATPAPAAHPRSPDQPDRFD